MPYYKISLPFKTDLPLFSFLDKRQLLKDFYQFVISKNYNSKNRVFAIINYLAYFNVREGLNHLLYGLDPAEKNEIKYQLLSSIEKTSDYKLKADISKAASLVLDPYYNEPIYTELAARYFWENFDVSYGETPKQFSVEQFIYDERFHYEDQVNKRLMEREVLDTLSFSLFSKLSKLNFQSFEVRRTEVILYSYCEIRKYLRPKHIFQLMEIILQSLTNYKQKKEFAEYLGSLSGVVLFRNISDDKEEGKKYAELLIGWYQKNWQKGWYIPKFFGEVIYKYPELKTKIDKQWSVWSE